MAGRTSHLPGFGVVVEDSTTRTSHLPGFGVLAETATAAAGKGVGPFTVLGVHGYPRPPYASFAGKAAAGPGTNRLLLINPPGLDGGFGTGVTM